MSTKDARGSRFNHLAREARDRLSALGLGTKTPDVVKAMRYEKPITLTPEEEDWVWDGGWEARVSRALRGVKVGGLRAIENLSSGYEQLVLLTYDQGCQVRDRKHGRLADDKRLADAWDRIIDEWQQRGTGLTFGEAFDEDEFGGFLEETGS